MNKLRYILLSASLMIATALSAQNITVKGVIKDASNGDPVPFASIRVDGTMTGGMSDMDGVYSISVQKNGTLIFSSIGYKDMSIPVNGRAEINVELAPDTEMIEETIVVAFGTATKESFTGSATVVKSDDISKVQSTDATRALEGMVAGVQMTTSDGALGSSPSIRIRGTGSIAAGNAPLYVVDGVPYPGDMNNLNTSDIESRTVLKDAASNALYTIGNDTDGNEHGYKLHLVYGALAAVSEKAYATINDSPEAITFSWEFTTTPVEVKIGDTTYKPTACITVDSTKFTGENASKLAALEAKLYGDTEVATLPLPSEVYTLLGGTAG